MRPNSYSNQLAISFRDIVFPLGPGRSGAFFYGKRLIIYFFLCYNVTIKIRRLNVSRLSQAIRDWMQENERNPAYIARKIGVATVTVRSWIYDVARPTGRTGFPLHELTGIPLETIFGNQKEEK